MNDVKIYRNVVSVNGIDMFYFDTKTKGDAIVCLHGRWGRAETWIRFMQHYGEKYRIIAPDQRGHGLSSKPISRYTADEFASDVIALIDYLKIASIIVVGHSMGGHAAGFLAATYPNRVKAVAILDKSAAGPEIQNTLPVEQIEPIDPITQEWPLPFSSLTEARDYIKKETESEFSYHYFVNGLYEDREGVHMMFSPQAVAANIAYYAQWFDLLPKIKCPTLLIKSSGEEIIKNNDFAKMQSLIGNCMAFEMLSKDHNVHLANPLEFYSVFDMFLNRLES